MSYVFLAGVHSRISVAAITLAVPDAATVILHITRQGFAPSCSIWVLDITSPMNALAHCVR